MIVLKYEFAQFWRTVLHRINTSRRTGLQSCLLTIVQHNVHAVLGLEMISFTPKKTSWKDVISPKRTQVRAGFKDTGEKPFN